MFVLVALIELNELEIAEWNHSIFVLLVLSACVL